MHFSCPNLSEKLSRQSRGLVFDQFQNLSGFDENGALRANVGRLQWQWGKNGGQFSVDRPALCQFLLGWQWDVDNLQRRRLTGQRKHFVHSNPGSDRCIAKAGLADGFLHTSGAQLGNVTQDPDDALFSCAYLCSFTLFDRPNRLSSDMTPFADFVCRPSLTQ